VLAANPNFLPVHYYLTKYYLQTGEYDLWLKEGVENSRLAGSASGAEFLQQVYARGGFHGVMLETAKPAGSDRLVLGSDSRQGSCYSAQANALLGRRAEALNALDDCYRWSATALIFLKVDPLWTSLRSEPRFQELLRRIHLQ
jgi:hypothetical protein